MSLIELKTRQLQWSLSQIISLSAAQLQSSADTFTNLYTYSFSFVNNKEQICISTSCLRAEVF